MRARPSVDLLVTGVGIPKTEPHWHLGLFLVPDLSAYSEAYGTRKVPKRRRLGV